MHIVSSRGGDTEAGLALHQVADDEHLLRLLWFLARQTDTSPRLFATFDATATLQQHEALRRGELAVWDRLWDQTLRWVAAVPERQRRLRDAGPEDRTDPDFVKRLLPPQWPAGLVEGSAAGEDFGKWYEAFEAQQRVVDDRSAWTPEVVALRRERGPEVLLSLQGRAPYSRWVDKSALLVSSSTLQDPDLLTAAMMATPSF